MLIFANSLLRKFKVQAYIANVTANIDLLKVSCILAANSKNFKTMNMMFGIMSQ